MSNMILKADKIIAGADLNLKENAALLIEDGKIKKIYENVGGVSVIDGIEVVDLGNKTIMMKDGNIVMELAGEERANMTTEKLLHKFHEQGMSNDRILFSAE